MHNNIVEQIKRSPIVRRFRPLLRAVYDGGDAIISKILQLRTPYTISRYNKLHLGCGPRHIPEWANIDIVGRGNIIWDLRKKLPVKPGSIRFIYTEHFIEHIRRPEALLLLKNCKEVLAEDGVLRISTPNLGRLVKDYLSERIQNMEHAGWRAATPCAMVNEGMRLWGHRFLYDEAELTLLLAEAGFKSVKRVQWGESKHPELRGLETRPDFDDVIVEAM